MEDSIKSHVERALARVELETEPLLAYMRALVFSVIALVYWATGVLGNDHTTLFSATGLGVLAFASLALAWSGIFRPWLPWIFATLDVALLLHCLAVLGLSMEMPFYGMLGMPGAALIFLFLAIAAVRQRPFLVLYTGALFLIGWLALWALAIATNPSAVVAAGPSDLPGEVARLSVIALTSIVLFVVVGRTRQALTASINEARLRSNLARYFCPTVAEELARSGPEARSLRLLKAAVMFVDMRGFTSLAESMTTNEVAVFLNEYRRRVCVSVSAHGGSVDKFIGDGVMAVFGTPKPSEQDARNAVTCGVELLQMIDQWNHERAAVRLSPVQIGIGVRYGEVTAGALGDEHRLEFTVVGDTVNAAKRIEELAGEIDARLLVSVAALEAAGWSGHAAAWEPLRSRILRGRRQSISLFRWREDRTSTLGRPSQTPVVSAGDPRCSSSGAKQTTAPVRSQCSDIGERMPAP